MWIKDSLKQLILHPITAVKHPRSIISPYSWCNDAFVSYLKSLGAKIGKNTRFINPSKCHVDINRAKYITIGDNCCLSFVTLLAHDYSWYVFGEANNDILPDGGGKIVIGNNCFIGYQAVILKNTKIGDNVIIGARSVVKGNIPSNTVWAGSPARQLCTLKDYYQRKSNERIKEALFRRDFIREIEKRDPTISEMGLFCFLYLERNEENYTLYIKNTEFNGVKNCQTLKDLFFMTHPIFNSFDDFLKYKCE